MNLTSVRRIGIIGAGEAGLATAKMLLTAGYECTVFERNTVAMGVYSHTPNMPEFPDGVNGRSRARSVHLGPSDDVTSPS